MTTVATVHLDPATERGMREGKVLVQEVAQRLAAEIAKRLTVTVEVEWKETD